MLGASVLKRLRGSAAIVTGLAVAATTATVVNAPAASAASDPAWYLTNSHGGYGDVVCTYGAAGDITVVGDWDGDGVDTPGVFRNGTWYLANTCGGPAEIVFGYGDAGDKPVVGDWNGDGIDTPGVVKGSTWHLSNTHGGGAEYVFDFGLPGDIPLVGDWNGDGTDWVGVYRDSAWGLSNSLSDPAWGFSYGSPGDYPVVGDWDGNGTDTPGIVRGEEWHLSNWFGGSAHPFTYGVGTDRRLAGDWNGDGVDTPGVTRQTTSSINYSIAADVSEPLSWLEQIPDSALSSQASIDAWFASRGIDRANYRAVDKSDCLKAIAKAVAANWFVVSKIKVVIKAFKKAGGVASSLKQLEFAYDYFRKRGYSRKSAISAAVKSVFEAEAVGAQAQALILEAFAVDAVFENCLP